MDFLGVNIKIRISFCVIHKVGLRTRPEDPVTSDDIKLRVSVCCLTGLQNLCLWRLVGLQVFGQFNKLEERIFLDPSINSVPYVRLYTGCRNQNRVRVGPGYRDV